MMQIHLQPGSTGIGSKMWKGIDLCTITPYDLLRKILLPVSIIKVAADLKSLVSKGEAVLP